MPNYFEFSRGDFMILASLFGMIIYGVEVCEIYFPLEEKAAAERKKKMDELLSDFDKDKFLADDELLSDFDKDKYLAEFKKVEETQDKSTSSKGDPNLMV